MVERILLSIRSIWTSITTPRASIDREKLLIPGADHTMSASTDPDRYWRRVNSFVKRVFGL